VSVYTTALDFTLPPRLEAHEPPEARGLPRDGVRMLVGRRASGEVSDQRFRDLPSVLSPGDILVVNTSATLPAAIGTTSRAAMRLHSQHVPVDAKRIPHEAATRHEPTAGERSADTAQPANGEIVVHVSTELPDGTWVVELRRRAGGATVPFPAGVAGQVYGLRGGGSVRLLAPYTRGRLWTARFTVDVVQHLLRYGQPIRYGYVDRDWRLSAYQTVFAPPVDRIRAGSAEMPSAARPFSDAVVTRLVAGGIVVAPVVLHAGVASPEAHEKPYPERFEVSSSTARLVNDAHRAGAKVIAVGTTVVRALESAADPQRWVRASQGWTDLVVTPARGVRVVDGLLTGFHEPAASHLAMLETVAGGVLLRTCYQRALDEGYLWHEFGDVNLLLP
jgi:S-adenosylmethionine:tRNA ribosyltransferase-isomerase